MLETPSILTVFGNAESCLLAEYEFFLYQIGKVDQGSKSTARFLQENSADALVPLTETATGYSLIRPVHNQDYYYSIFKTCEKFDCAIEGWHTETGPGVFEAVCPAAKAGMS